MLASGNGELAAVSIVSLICPNYQLVPTPLRWVPTISTMDVPVKSVNVTTLNITAIVKNILFRGPN